MTDETRSRSPATASERPEHTKSGVNPVPPSIPRPDAPYPLKRPETQQQPEVEGSEAANEADK